MIKEIIIMMVTLLACAGCSRSGSQGALKQFTKTGEFFGAEVRLDVCYENREEAKLNQAVNTIWSRFADIHRRMSVYDPGSDINKINNAYEDSVLVGADTYQLIKDSVSYHKISNNVFDISIGPLLMLWKESQKRNSLPSAEEIKAAQDKLGVAYIALLPDNHIRLVKQGMKINVDSIGDGYAADEAARILRNFGFENFLIDASGELYGGGKNCHGNLWRIGIRDPLDPVALMEVVYVSNAAVSTSGNYERYYEVEGQRFSHIINPLTGYPHNEILSATVIAPSAQFADFWSTALCVLNAEEGRKLTDSFNNDYASMVIVEEENGSTKTFPSRQFSQFQKH